MALFINLKNKLQKTYKQYKHKYIGYKKKHTPPTPVLQNLNKVRFVVSQNFSICLHHISSYHSSQIMLCTKVPCTIVYGSSYYINIYGVYVAITQSMLACWSAKPAPEEREYRTSPMSHHCTECFGGGTSCTSVLLGGHRTYQLIFYILISCSIKNKVMF